MNKRRGMISDEGASVAVEAALLFPVVMLLLVMATDTISYFSAVRKLSAAAATAGDLLANAGENVDQAALSRILAASAPSGIAADAPTDIGMTFNVYQEIDGYQAPRWEYWENVYCGIPNGTDVSNLLTDGADVLVAGACFNWSPITFSVFGLDPRPIAQYTIVRPKRSVTMLCSDCY